MNYEFGIWNLEFGIWYQCRLVKVFENAVIKF